MPDEKNDIEMLRPGDGISPMDMDLVIGKVMNRNIKGPIPDKVSGKAQQVIMAGQMIVSKK